MNDMLKIEEMEKNMLFKLGDMFRSSLDDFYASMSRSLKYLGEIVLPIVMASKDDRSYNPFSEIIEKYVLHILSNKFVQRGFSLLPLGYSSDLTLEGRDCILNIDIKTANIDNPSDFGEKINIGINQLTHVAKLSRNREYLPSPYFIYPSIPPFYEVNNQRKIVLTFALMFIYPSYRDLISSIRKDYRELINVFTEKVIPIISGKYNIPNSKISVIVENLIRGVFIHKREKKNILSSLGFSGEEREKIIEFSQNLDKFVKKLQERDIKPLAIIAVAIPNGLLKVEYLDKFVSGKNYGKSARYYYKHVFFEVIKKKLGKEFPRFIFLDLNENYLDILKGYFDKIFVLEPCCQLKVL